MNAPAKLDFSRQSEYLRLAIKAMSDHRVPMTPRNYWVWHEYVSGGNQSLHDELSQAVAKAVEIDDKFMEDLYVRYISNVDFEMLNEVHDLFVRIAVSMSDALHKAVVDSDRFGNSLQQASQQLTKPLDASAINTLVDILSLATHQMSDGNQVLKGKLDESRREVEILRAELEQVRRECNRDSLTGLANRRGFREKLDQLSETIDILEKSSLLIADIDRFKQVNDQYGHLLGDKVIVAVARIIERVVGDRGLASRYGGEEFAVMLPEIDLGEAKKIAEEIRDSVQRGKVVNPRSGEALGKVTISVGASQFKANEPLDVTLEKADQALYWAKEGGRNRVMTNE